MDFPMFELYAEKLNCVHTHLHKVFIFLLDFIFISKTYLSESQWSENVLISNTMSHSILLNVCNF